MAGDSKKVITTDDLPFIIAEVLESKETPGLGDKIEPERSEWILGFDGLSLGATGGIHTAEDAIKLLLAGADVVHLCSALLAKGPAYVGTVLNGVTHNPWKHGTTPGGSSGGTAAAVAAKENVRLLECGSWGAPLAALDYKRVNGGLLVQDRDLGRVPGLGRVLPGDEGRVGWSGLRKLFR